MLFDNGSAASIRLVRSGAHSELDAHSAFACCKQL